MDKIRKKEYLKISFEFYEIVVLLSREVIEGLFKRISIILKQHFNRIMKNTTTLIALFYFVFFVSVGCPLYDCWKKHIVLTRLLCSETTLLLVYVCQANISDIAINEFQNLYRILQYHGRGNYRRIAIVIKYCFFKPMVITLVLFLFSCYNGFTGTFLFPTMLASLFDVLLVLPIAVLGWLDRDIEADAILRFPQLYHVSRTNSDLSVKKFFIMLAGMVWYSFCIFYVSWAFMALMERFGLGDLYSLGCILYFALILCLTVTVMMKQSTWTWVHGIVYVCFQHFCLVSCKCWSLEKLHELGHLFFIFFFFFLVTINFGLCVAPGTLPPVYSSPPSTSPRVSMSTRAIRVLGLYCICWAMFTFGFAKY